MRTCCPPSFKQTFIILLLLFNNKYGFSQQYHLKNYSINDGLAGISVTCMLQDSRGYIWIGTEDGGISRFDGNAFENYDKRDGIGDDAINCLFEDKLGNIWIGTEKNGITKFNGYEFIQYNKSTVKNIDKIFSDTSGQILIYSFPSLYKLEGDSIILANEKKNDQELQQFLKAGGSKTINSLIDKNGHKWIATYSGLFTIKKEFLVAEDAYDHKMQFIFNSENIDEPASSLMQDREGNIWIGTSFNGVYMFYDGAFSNFNNLPSLKNTFITSMQQIDNLFFIGTSKGLKKIKYAAEENMYEEDPVYIPGFVSTSQINCIFKNEFNELYIADENNNIIQYKQNFNQFRISEIQDNTQITSITNDKDNNTWIATNNSGVFVWNNKIVQHYTKNDSLSSNSITSLFTDSKGNIWIATEGEGVMKFDNKEFTPFSYFENGLINNNISCIAEDQNGLIWFGSPDGGICSFNGNDFSFFTDNDVLTSNHVVSITFDNSGNLWAGLNNGIDQLIFNVDSTITTKHFDEYDGFTGIKNYKNAILCDATGRILFGTVNGLFRYNPGEDIVSQTQPLVELRNIRLNYETTDWFEFSDTLMGWYNLPVNLQLPHDKNHLTFDFSAIYFSVHEKIIYEVQLEGFDDFWQNIANNTSMTYSNLKPGNYTFKVKAKNADGVWSEPTTYSFIINKPFWSTLFFQISFGVLILSILILLNYLRDKQLRKRSTQLEQTVQIRTTELEQQKIQAVASALRAERSEKAKEEFLANMSHEIRTPMNAIMGMTRLLIEKKPKETQLKYLNAIRQSSDNLLVIINDILDLSKIQAGKMEMENIPFIIREQLGNLEAIMKFKSDEKNISFKINIDKNIPECLVGDQVRLNQILINLTGNAIKFTENGYVHINCKLRSIENKIAVIAFEIEDTGLGIEKEKIGTIFESFSQADKATTRKFGGTGLGLSITKRLIELYRGELFVKSEIGKGSTFTVEIPFIIGDITILDKQKVNGFVLQNDLHSNFKILLVEDNVFNQMVAVDSIEAMFKDATIDIAENGKIAIEKISEIEFDLILMDVQMPVMDGYETTRMIRNLSDDKKSKTPIVAMTASVIKSEVDKCFESGMNDFIAKPFEPEDLRQKILKYANQ